MLTLTSFAKSYDSSLILDVPALSFEKGIHWIKGKNGSGKSTLFNCLSGLSPYKGNIRLNNVDLSKSPGAYKLKVNYSQSEPVFPEFLSANELIRFFAKLKKAPAGQIEQLKESLGVTSYAQQPCGTYSSGMLKKLSLLLSFIGEPECIILDEPLITLDKEAQHMVSDLIRTGYDNGVMFLFATHQDFENEQIEPTHGYEVKDQTISIL